jgi:hypothetical protein
MVHNSIHKNKPPDPILRNRNPLLNALPFLFRNHFNTILKSTPCISSDFPVKVKTKNYQLNRRHHEGRCKLLKLISIFSERKEMQEDHRIIRTN